MGLALRGRPQAALWQRPPGVPGQGRPLPQGPQGESHDPSLPSASQPHTPRGHEEHRPQREERRGRELCGSTAVLLPVGTKVAGRKWGARSHWGEPGPSHVLQQPPPHTGPWGTASTTAAA